jgi:hypothetical protein
MSDLSTLTQEDGTLAPHSAGIWGHFKMSDGAAHPEVRGARVVVPDLSRRPPYSPLRSAVGSVSQRLSLEIIEPLSDTADAGWQAGEMPNRLATATSPYLLQHADNPVDWWEWGDEAFAEARRRDVPILLSVGYAACHWCHVMAHESFEDDGVAGVVNARFVAVKVDREERPDVDAVYMTATTELTGQGGWPMTCFLTPDGEPFYCGTYYPREQFPALLDAVTEAWTQRRDAVVRQGAAISTNLPGAGRAPPIRRLGDRRHSPRVAGRHRRSGCRWAGTERHP